MGASCSSSSSSADAIAAAQGEPSGTNSSRQEEDSQHLHGEDNGVENVEETSLPAPTSNSSQHHRRRRPRRTITTPTRRSRNNSSPIFITATAPTTATPTNTGSSNGRRPRSSRTTTTTAANDTDSSNTNNNINGRDGGVSSRRFPHQHRRGRRHHRYDNNSRIRRPISVDDNEDVDEIEQLQQELAAMEAFYQLLLNQMYERQQMRAGEGEGIGGAGEFATYNINGRNSGAYTAAGETPSLPLPPAPPACSRAIRQLPTVVASPEDLVEKSNRECCICYMDIVLGTHVTRLPCGHLYHRPCVTQWLSNHHCTCPVCRYELPTNDPMYEVGRVERMKHRKIRLRRYELECMSIRELKELAFQKLRLHETDENLYLVVEKRDLIQSIVQSGKVDIVEGPPPLQYSLVELRSMNVTALKRTMMEAGVFFNAVDVVEKEDMVQLFVNSGRIILLPDKEEDAVENISDDDDDGTRIDGKTSSQGNRCGKMGVCKSGVSRTAEECNESFERGTTSSVSEVTETKDTQWKGNETRGARW